MKKVIKKIISLTLCLVLLAAVAAPAGSAAENKGYITIYVEGFSRRLYKNNIDADENEIWPPKVDIEAIVKNDLGPILKELASGIVTGNYDQYCDNIYNALAPIFAEMKLDDNGEASDGSGWGGDMLTDSYDISYSTFPNGRIRFSYDWRLSVEHNAAILEKFIDRVCREQNVEKVNLLGRCMGGNLVNSYLQNAKNIDKVENVVMYIPSTMGMNLIGGLFSGNITFDDETINAFVDYTVNQNNLFGDEVTNQFVTALLALFNELKILGIGLDAFQLAFDNVKDDIVPRLVRATFGTFPGFWAMIPEKYYQEALDYNFGTPELKAQYAGLIEKAESYHDNVQLNAYNRMTELQNNGMRFIVISKYNVPQVPVMPEANMLGDGLGETSNMAFGATAALHNSTLEESYINSLSSEAKKYVSPDKMIDASTCHFPDTTWFIKDCHHNYFPDSVDVLINAFYENKDMTVFTYDEFPQYLQFYGQTDSEASGLIKPIEPVEKEELSDFRKLINSIVNFFKSLVNLILNAFKAKEV